MDTVQLPGGTVVQPGRPFEFGGVAYPANWIQCATDADLVERGLQRVTLAPQPAPVVSLQNAKDASCTNIDVAAGDAISMMRSDGLGLSVVYDAQRAEMMEYLALTAANEPTPAELFPVMSALIGIVGANLGAVAETVRLRVTAEAQRLASINAIRLSAKASIRAAASVEQVASIEATARAQIEGA